jgi:hypothetical protein
MSKTSDSTLSSLFDVSQNTSEQALAARYAPVIRFDAHEPFLPLAAGYTIFRHSGPSPSFKQGHEIDLTPEGQPPCWEQHPNPSGLLTSAWVARVREAGLGIICWNEDRPEEITALRQVGVDGICSDAPELLQG